MQQRKAICTNWMRELRRMSRELSAVTVSMKAQDVLLPLPSAEETLFDFINEDEVKVLLVAANQCFFSAQYFFRAGSAGDRRPRDAAAEIARRQ